jgi:hypothetical protein
MIPIFTINNNSTVVIRVEEEGVVLVGVVHVEGIEGEADLAVEALGVVDADEGGEDVPIEVEADVVFSPTKL